MVLADYDDYVAAQARIDAEYADREQWLRKAILNVARMGQFSIDRVTREYAAQIWGAEPVFPG
jgi:starch phosphorylase